VDCDRFRTGVYTMVSEMDGVEYIFTRTDSIQTETTNASDGIAKARIKWTGPCTYELFQLSFEGGTDEERDLVNNETFNKLAQTPMKVTILQTAADYYIYEVTAKGILDEPMRDTLFVVQVSN
jgi:hypothetical protein